MKCWIVFDHGKTGTLNQCLGLAERLGFTPEIKAVEPRFPWRYIPPSCWLFPLTGLTPETRLSPPWPDLIIAGGRSSAAPVAKIRKITRGKTKVIQLLNPKMDPGCFDAVIAPLHDHLSGPNVIQTLGPLHRVTPFLIQKAIKEFGPLLSTLKPPIATILIGGPNRYYHLDKKVMEQLVSDLRHLSIEKGYSLAVTVSRRTSTECRAYLREQLQDLNAVLWDGAGPNPYFAFLGAADAILVTADSISMITEAASTGKPVYIYPLPGHSRKFSFFYKNMIEGNHARFFEEEFSEYPVEILDNFSLIHAEILRITRK